MPSIISSILPFPNLCWWAYACTADEIVFDEAEHFEKMTYRNRYYITGPNGLIQLSIPLLGGRGQRSTMRDMHICNKDRWQVQHWRTLVSVYNRAAYFQHYAPGLEALYQQKFERLTGFNLASIHWLKQQLKAGFTETAADSYKKEYADMAADLRHRFKPKAEKQGIDTHVYYQLFSERNGFLPNLSMLDLLFSEGPHAMQWIRSHKEMALDWRQAI
jgi:WbqC-like protein family.